MSSNILELEHVWISYEPGVYVVEDASFTVSKGDFMALIGPNGGGKTTLLKAMIGLIKPVKGTIKLFGKDIRSFDEWSWIGYVPQNIEQKYTWFPLSVEEFMRLKSPKAKISINELHKTLEFVGLWNIKDKRISELSGGQFQRLYIAKEIMSSPKLLLLDEPTSSIDISFKKNLYEVLIDINENMGTTIIMSTHDAATISTYIKKIVCINKRVYHVDNIEELLSGSALCRMYGHHVYGLKHVH